MWYGTTCWFCYGLRWNWLLDLIGLFGVAVHVMFAWGVVWIWGRLTKAR